MRARYTWSVNPPLIVITDLNRGDKTVTNDVERVIGDFVGFGVDLRSKRLIYCDTDGNWDGIATRGNRFVSFISLRCRSEQAAVELAKAMEHWLFDGV